MIFRKAALALSLAGSLVAFSAHPAAAQLQTFTFDSAGFPTQSSVVSLSTDGGATFTSVYAGRYQGHLGNGPAFNIFCTDVNHEIAPPLTYQADVSQKITAACGATARSATAGYNGGLASAIMTSTDYQVSGMPTASTAAQLQAATRADEVAWLADSYLNAALTPLQSAGVGLSIWDIIETGGTDLSGSVQVNSGDANFSTYKTFVNTYEAGALAAVNGGYKSSNSARWIQSVMSGGTHAQDYVYQVTPEPKTSVLFLSFGVIGFGCWLRRRRADAS